MNLRFIPLLAVLLFALSLGFACGDDDDGDSGGDGGDGGSGEQLTLEAYFGELRAVLDDIDAKDDELLDDHPDAFSDPDDTQEYYDGLIPVLNGAFDDIDALNPPDDAKDQHDAFVETGRDFVDVIEDLASKVGDLESEEELEEYFAETEESEEFTTTLNAFGRACGELQDIADSNDIEVDLECADIEEDVEGDDAAAEEMTLEDYLSATEDIFSTADEASDRAEEDFGEAVDAAATLDEQVEAIDVFLTRIIDIFDTAISELEALDPPEEAQGPHDSFLDAARSTAETAAEFQAAVLDASTEDEINDLSNEFDARVSSEVENADAACFELQAVADDNGIDVDLDCAD